ncbi:MAG: hypothetical protein IPJ07_09135 [Acidobacteria bacterium]|nr:hypothetical protein [Acidobacteriota bacterium]
MIISGRTTHHRLNGLKCKEAKSFFRMYGGINGGTLATMFNKCTKAAR